MTIHEVILRAMSGELTWLRAADILGMDPRSLRRWKARWEAHGHSGLLDRRLGRPSPRRSAVPEVERIVKLYRDRYIGFNVRHFHEVARREHGVSLSYSFVKKALQTARLVKKHKVRGRHRLRRERRACFGEMLHIDGSFHPWLALCGKEKQTLIAVPDDATSRVLYAQLVDSESTDTVMAALRHVVIAYGVPMALYSDRASWAAWTPKAGGPVDKAKPTQVGRALRRLGVEHILAYSPQARGRGERLNRTFQDRLINELRVAGIRTVAAANRYLVKTFLPRYNEVFAQPPREATSAFVGLAAADIDQILCHEEERVVGQDNTVSLEGVRMQLHKQPGRATCAGGPVIARRHLDGSHSIWRGPLLLGCYDEKGRWLEPANLAA